VTGRDVGFDQIVPFEKTGKEYIFVKGIGTDELERVYWFLTNLILLFISTEYLRHIVQLSMQRLY
jgi:hypothetical protein